MNSGNASKPQNVYQISQSLPYQQHPKGSPALCVIHAHATPCSLCLWVATYPARYKGGDYSLLQRTDVTVYFGFTILTFSQWTCWDCREEWIHWSMYLSPCLIILKIYTTHPTDGDVFVCTVGIDILMKWCFVVSGEEHIRVVSLCATEQATENCSIHPRTSSKRCL